MLILDLWWNMVLVVLDVNEAQQVEIMDEYSCGCSSLQAIAELLQQRMVRRNPGRAGATDFQDSSKMAHE